MALRAKLLLLVCIGIAALTQVAGCDRAVDPQRLLADARQLREKGDDKAAVIQLKNALQNEPDLVEARYLLGMTYIDLGDPASGEKELRRALELGIDRAPVMPSIAWSLIMQGRYQQALKETDLDPKSAELLAVRGYAELALLRLTDAAKSFEEAIRLEPQYTRALLGQARVAAAEGRLDDARVFVDRVLAAQPRDVDAWIFSADLYSQRANRDRAEADLGQALKIQPGNVTAHLRRASLLAISGNFVAAQTDIDAARRIAPENPLVTYSQAVLEFHWGKFQPGLESVQKVLKVAPDHMPSVMLAGLLEYRLDHLEQAERHVTRFVDQYPNHLYARKLLAGILLRNKQDERALQVLQPALKQAPQDAQLLALAGEAYMQKRNFGKASEFLQQAATLQKENADVHAKLGMTQLALGNADRAVVELESAVDLSRNLSQADVLLVMTYLREQKYDKALDTAIKLQKKQPENPVSYDLLGGAYLGKKDLVNARKNFERALALQPDYLPAAMLLARLDLRANDAEGARKRFKAMLAKDEKNAGAMIGLASIDRATGNVDGYVAWLEKARNQDPAALMPRLLLARHYLSKNDPKKALLVASEARAIQPGHPDALNLLGEAQSANGAKVDAVTTYVSLVNAVPLSPDAHYRLAMAHIANENYAAAKEPLRKALGLRPDYVDAEAALALLEYRAGRYDESLRIAQQIRRHDPKSPVGYTLEGDALMAQKKYAPAEKAYQAAFALRKSGALATKLHAALSGAGKSKEANDRLGQWLREHPADTLSRLYLADVYVKQRQNPAAIELYRQVLEKEPNNVLAVNNLAILYRQQGDPRALEYFEQSHKANPDNVAFAHNLGWVLVERGELERGLDILNNAAAKAPDNLDLRYHLAAALAKSGDKARARDELTLLLGKDKPFQYRSEAQALLKQL